MFTALRTMILQRWNRKNIYSTAEYWDSKAAAYNGSAVSGWMNQNLNRLYEEEQHRVIERFLGDVTDLEILDVGCGTGRYSRWFAKRGAKVTGVDFSQETLKIAHENFRSVENPSFLQGSVYELDRNGVCSYDLIFECGLLTVACRDKEQLWQALTRIKACLKTNGRLFLLDPIHSNFLHRVLDLSLHDFLLVLEQAGFRSDVVVPMHFWPMRLVLAYINWPSFITIPLYHFGQTIMKLPGLRNAGDYFFIVARLIDHTGK